MRFIIPLLLLSCTAYGEPPKAVLNAPTQATPGELIVFDASRSINATYWKWSVSPEIPGRIMFESDCADRSRIRPCTIPGNYRYTLVVGNAEDADVLYHDFHVPGTPPPVPVPPQPVPPGPAPLPGPEPQPNPAPNPEPAPPPKPVVPVPPEGRFKLVAQSIKWAQSVDSASRKSEAAAVAEVFEGIASRIAAGGLTAGNSPTQQELLGIFNALNTANNAALGGAKAVWKAGFGDQLGTAIGVLYNGGQLKTNQDFIDLLNEVASALRYVSKV